MKAVIFPTLNLETCYPLTEWVPEYLLPVVNKPVVEHLVELLVRHDIKEVVLVMKHLPYETENYFKDGSRWGVRMTYQLESTFHKVWVSLSRFRSLLDDVFIGLPGNIITDLNFSGMVDFHRKNSHMMTVFSGEEKGLWERSFQKSKESLFQPFIANPECLRVFEDVPDNGRTDEFGQRMLRLRSRGLPCGEYVEACRIHRISSLKDLSEVNRSVLRKEIKTIILPGNEIREGVWIGRRAKVDREANLFSPCLVGEDSRIFKGSRIEAGSVIGDQVIVDKNVVIDKSIILKGSYIGPFTEVRNAIVGKSRLIDILRGIDVFIREDFIIGDLEKGSLIRGSLRIYNFLVCLFLLVLFSPILLILLLYHSIFPPKPYLLAERRYGSFKPGDLEGKIVPNPFFLYRFDSKYRFISKLPGLINVLKGDLSLVGNPPLSEEEKNNFNEDRNAPRWQAPQGLFHIWEIEGREDLSKDEKITAENFYAGTRSFWGDIKILVKSIFPFIVG